MTQHRERELLQELDKLTTILSLVAIVALVLLYFLLATSTNLDSHLRDFGLGIILNLIPILLVFVVSYFLFRKIQSLKSDQEKDELAEEFSKRIESKIRSSTTFEASPIAVATSESREPILQNPNNGEVYLIDRNGFPRPIKDKNTLLYFAEVLGYQPDQLPKFSPDDGKPFGPEVIPFGSWRPPKTPQEKLESEVSWKLQYLGKSPRLEGEGTVLTFTFRNDNEKSIQVHSAKLHFINGAPIGITDVSSKNKPTARGVLEVTLLFDDGNSSGIMLPGKECNLNLIFARVLSEKEARTIQGLSMGYIELASTYSETSVNLHHSSV